MTPTGAVPDAAVFEAEVVLITMLMPLAKFANANGPGETSQPLAPAPIIPTTPGLFNGSENL